MISFRFCIVYLYNISSAWVLRTKSRRENFRPIASVSMKQNGEKEGVRGEGRVRGAWAGLQVCSRWMNIRLVQQQSLLTKILDVNTTEF
ncbi:hypothetical protein VTK26DRAFT_3781 [Humicola hyalothermophila]